MTKEIVKFDGFQDFLAHMAQERPDAIALLHGANERFNRVTWAAFAADIAAREAQLREAGKTCIAITNLPPRAMMGIESCGMLLSAVHSEEGAEKLNLLMVSNKIPAGAKLY